MKPAEGRSRVVIEAVEPQVDCGRYPVCRVIGDTITVTAAIFADGHDHVAARLMYRHAGERRWRALPMTSTGNDCWTAAFTVDKLGSWSFTIQAWVDHFHTWCADLKKRIAAQPEPSSSDATPLNTANAQDIPLALRSGALLIDAAAKRAKGTDASSLAETSASIRWMADQAAALYDYPLSDEMEALVARYPNHEFATKHDGELPVWVDRVRARYSTWYELFPRSTSPEPGAHGTFRDVIAQLPAISDMGFDILYLPPIHPIGTAFRKGKNNATTALPGDHGSPWAIGGADGGHTALHAELGTMADFDALVVAAEARHMELALDIAFQCSPDHPWVKAHPTWFIIRPDGSIQYAENPPKKYQDIYPLNFESADWRSLWEALRDVFDFWIKRGVKVFRVDNPHTKSLRFWEWCIGEIRQKHPDVIFLAEAFTRPHVMYSLAKAGFTQSYTYFTWRTEKAEIEAYLKELTSPPVSDFFRPNFWPNTPDILHKSLQDGGRPAFMQRLILAATLAANYGIYGPAYELAENAAAKPSPGKTESEEYLHSEKYEIRQRDRNAPGSLVGLITNVNNIRRANAALQTNEGLHFHFVDNPNLMCYSKSDMNLEGVENTILVAINLDPHNEQGGWIDLDLKRLGIPHDENFIVEDLLTNQRYTWHDRSNYVALRPDVQPAHIFRVTRQG